MWNKRRTNFGIPQTKLTGFKDINMKGLQTRLVPLLVIAVLISGLVSLTSVYADEDAYNDF